MTTQEDSLAPTAAEVAQVRACYIMSRTYSFIRVVGNGLGDRVHLLIEDGQILVAWTGARVTLPPEAFQQAAREWLARGGDR